MALLTELIRLLLDIPGEDRKTEFKRLGSDLKVIRILEAITSLANTDGGIVILGIDDPEKSKLRGLDRVFGLEENPVLFDEIGRCLKQIIPPLAGIWPPARYPFPNGKTVAVVPVPKATDSFHTVDEHVFVRGEKGKRRLTPHEIVKYAYAKGFQHADAELVEVDFELLTTAPYEQWRRERKLPNEDIREILFRLGLARKNQAGELRPTRAAVLLFAEHPTTLLDTKCAIRVIQYEGTLEKIEQTLNLIGKPKTIGGPVAQQIAVAHEYVLGLLRAGMRIPASGFVTTYQIPERAVKEAITNAVIHRDYHLKRDIEVRIFEDRIEIESPGLFPSNITTANIGRERAESYRNDQLVKHLREFPEPPNLDQNEGVRAMRREMDRGNLYPPLFWTYPHLPDSVEVILLNQKRSSDWDKVQHYLSHQDRVVTNVVVRRITHNPDTTKVSRMLKRWVEQGLLMKVGDGSKRNARYGLPDTDPQGELFSAAIANEDD